MQTCPPVVELRRYTLKPGRRDDLIELFEREFVETQEAEGMTLLGQFRDLDAPDRFVWMRGFADMERRREALSAFYGGPVWKANRTAANDTMIDSDDVLLLRPVGAPMAVPARSGEGEAGAGITATVLYLAEPADAGLRAWFEAEVRPAVLGAFETEAAANTFPALPVREGEHAFVWLARGPGPERLPAWLERRLVRPPEVMRLAPTPRSRMR